MEKEKEMAEGVLQFDETTISAQRAARSGSWRMFKKILEKDPKRLMEPFDLFGNTAIHIATRSNNPGLLRELLEMLSEKERWHALRKGNCVNNTLLHEIVFCTTVEMAAVVLKFENEAAPEDIPEEKKRLPLLEIINDSGETPLFRAAKLGRLKMLKYMVNHAEGDIRRLFVRLDKYSILHASILGQFFDVAIWLLNMDEKLAQHKDMNGMTCLQLLSNMPLVFRSQAPAMGAVKNLIYNMLPEEGYEIHDDDENGSADDYTRQRNDIESGQQDKAKLPSSVLSRINYAVWRTLAKEFDGIGRIWQLKKQHKLAKHLSELLVEKDFSWQISFHENFQPLIVLPVLSSKSDRIKHLHHTKEMHKINSEMSRSRSYRPITTATTHSQNYTSLLMAAGSGIVEIVGKIIDRFPEAICHVSQDQHNVLHMAVKHRQLKIFNMLKKHSAFKSLIFRITAEGRTLLHQISRMEFYVEQHLPGVAFQLQDELRWYERVKNIVPTYYLMHCDKDGLTAEDVLEMEHREMHKEAKGWIKETAQSCSTVAVLVATVVFAAAYTIPGGTNQNNGTPLFLGSRVFLFYTVTDVVALVSSLASVVMFLSILTSPFELWDFRRSLPQKLSLGFACLFFSLVCTMLTFSATVLLTIRLENHQKWASVLFCCAVFFPVAFFWRMQFPLYKMIQRLAKRLFKTLRQAVPTTFVKYVIKIIFYCKKNDVQRS
ncbi:hypothetical protein VIGAN_06240700 [Vigna angularis var. angularis]|uniref:PGG domain-containing protein n=1 Tax=Vigna angularis var. angularis TaxID=157739 RepID=A0A0S3SE56_PHAAN|nr:hypothetical protein VIGAN_06240700 [Vigna angularis var. angularis]